MKKPFSLLSIALCAVPALACANGTSASIFSYSYIEAGAVRQSLEFSGVAIENTDLDGVVLGGSYAINPNIAVGGSYVVGEAKTRADFNQGGIDELVIDVTGPSVFVLYHDALNANTDWLAGAEYAKLESEFKRGNGQAVEGAGSDEASKSVFVGARHQLNEQIEINLTVDYDLDAEDDEDEISFDGGIRFQFNETLDAGVSFAPNDDGDVISVNVRKYLF